jgi:hypothetical protein
VRERNYVVTGRRKVTVIKFPINTIAGAFECPLIRRNTRKGDLSCFINKKIAGTVSRCRVNDFKTRATK